MVRTSRSRPSSAECQRSTVRSAVMVRGAGTAVALQDGFPQHRNGRSGHGGARLGDLIAYAGAARGKLPGQRRGRILLRGHGILRHGGHRVRQRQHLRADLPPVGQTLVLERTDARELPGLNLLLDDGGLDVGQGGTRAAFGAGLVLGGGGRLGLGFEGGRGSVGRGGGLPFERCGAECRRRSCRRALRALRSGDRRRQGRIGQRRGFRGGGLGLGGRFGRHGVRKRFRVRGDGWKRRHFDGLRRPGFGRAGLRTKAVDTHHHQQGRGQGQRRHQAAAGEREHRRAARTLLLLMEASQQVGRRRPPQFLAVLAEQAVHVRITMFVHRAPPSWNTDKRSRSKPRARLRRERTVPTGQASTRAAWS